MGFKTVLTGATFADSSLPIIRNDALLSKGSLFLFDPSHSMGGFNGTASQTVVPNIAWKEASALMPGETAETLSGKVFLNLAPGEIMVERTAKKGVHILNSLVNQTTDRNWNIWPSGKILNYMVQNGSAHKFYVSLWMKRTRKGLGPAGSVFHLFRNPVGSMFIAPDEGLNGNGRMNFRTVNTNGGVEPFVRFSNTDINGVTGSPDLLQLGAGMLSSYSGNTYRNKQNSVILYRAYIEDLTVSGRTYAEVDALDYALHQEAFAVGGRFYGDAYTDPSMLP